METFRNSQEAFQDAIRQGELEDTDNNISFKDRLSNIKLILEDITLNSNWGRTREDFYDVDDQCDYLETQLEHLVLQVKYTNVRRDI